ncbi:TetR/AcrR family transcriptional regulator [Desertibaculum subflavum]|uniref:TetR/AcrR family transcriptional regulator n=1 Tax=Desertibaculum subflavum TaxID=2268458 RepID=UPI0013C510BF
MAGSTKDSLMQAAVRLFAAKGIDGTTTREIAAAAGVTEGAIYRHFVGKEALVEEIFHRHYLPFAAELDAARGTAEGAEAELRAVVRRVYAAFDRDRDLFAFLLLAQHGPMRRIADGAATPVRVIEKLVRAGQRAGTIRRMDARLATQIVLGAVLQPATGSLYGEVSPPLIAIADQVAEAAWRAIAG